MSAAQPAMVRRSVVAGSWYPGTAAELRRTVDEYLAEVKDAPVPGTLLGLISPHAGYAYSGLTAAHAYHQVAGRPVETVVILAPSHRAWLPGPAVSAEDAYETPLGTVLLDRALIAELEREVALERIRRDAEHSLEIQLPFLQRQLPAFRLVPILMSSDDPAAARDLGAALAGVIARRPEGEGRVLIVASSDMHHIENYDAVVRRDEAVREAVAAFDQERTERLLMDPGCSVCGRMPILAVLHAGGLLGADQVHILHHTNSGDVTGQRRAGQYTVGYMAAAVVKSR